MNIDVKRVMRRLEELYECGKKEDGTHARIAFSEEDQKGRELFSGYFKELGVEAQMDEAGNLFLRMEGEEPSAPSILLGSHLDTVPDGGKYDGVLGCVAGLEVCEMLVRENKKLKHPLEVVVFTDEEGFRFGSGLLGSSALCGEDTKIAEEDVDMYGETRKEVLKSYGITAANSVNAVRKADTVHCFMELHVEQGAALYKNQIPIGVVSTIAGVSRYEVAVKGQANHSGSTMMFDRRDALAAAAGLIASVPQLTKQYGNEYTVATVGTIRVLPNSVNVIPSDCIFNLEIRDQSSEVIACLEQKFKECLAKQTEKYADSFTFRRISYHDPAPMTPWVKEIIQQAADEAGYPSTAMPSGAFHDSLVMSQVFPTGMIFIPSIGGISHSPLEKSLEADIEKGCNVLLKAVLAADKL